MKYKPIKPLKKQELARGTFLCQTFFALIELKSLTKKYGAIKNQNVVLLLYRKPSKKGQLLLNDLFQLMMIKENWNLKYSIPLFLYDHRYDL